MTDNSQTSQLNNNNNNINLPNHQSFTDAQQQKLWALIIERVAAAQSEYLY